MAEEDVIRGGREGQGMIQDRLTIITAMGKASKFEVGLCSRIRY